MYRCSHFCKKLIIFILTMKNDYNNLYCFPAVHLHPFSCSFSCFPLRGPTPREAAIACCSCASSSFSDIFLPKKIGKIGKILPIFFHESGFYLFFLYLFFLGRKFWRFLPTFFWHGYWNLCSVGMVFETKIDRKIEKRVVISQKFPLRGLKKTSQQSPTLKTGKGF